MKRSENDKRRRKRRRISCEDVKTVQVRKIISLCNW